MYSFFIGSTILNFIVAQKQRFLIASICINKSPTDMDSYRFDKLLSIN